MRLSSTLLVLVSFMAWLPSVETPTGEPTNAQEATAKPKSGPTPLTPAQEQAYQVYVAGLTPEAQAWERVLGENLGTFYLPGYQRDKLRNTETAWDYVRDDPALPRMLIIGDSISRGYTIPVRKALAGKVNVHRAPTNCGPTSAGLKSLDTWLGSGKWDVISFNFGIHDRATDSTLYATNLEKLVSRLSATGAKLIWVRTTPAPIMTTSAKIFSPEQCQRMNELADQVIKPHKIPMIDLYALMAAKREEYQIPNDVHFKKEGYQAMGREIAQTIQSLLAPQP